MHAHFKKASLQLKAVEKITPLVTRVMGHNPGPFTLQGSNTYIVGKGPSKILIDTGEGKEAYITSLREALGGSCIEKILLTHWHPDHVGGLSSVLGMDVAAGAEVFKMPEPNQDGNIFSAGDKVLPITEGDVFTTEGATLRAIYAPGHTKDHMCFVLEEENSLFTGDIVLGQGSSHFSNLTQYMETLQRLLKVAEAGEGCRLYTAHGPCPEDGKAKIKEQIDHRLLRDKQILETLRSQQVSTAAEIVAVLYHDVPKRLHNAAATNVILHLLNLEAKGQVTGERQAPSAPFDLGGKTTPSELTDLFKTVTPNITAKWRLTPTASL